VRCANLNVASRPARSIDEDRADRRLIGIAYGQALEAITTNEFIAGLAGEGSLRVGIDRTGGEQGLFYVTPALAPRMGVSTLLGDGGGTGEPGIEMRERILHLAGETGDDLGRLHLAIFIYVDEARIRLRDTGGAGAGESEDANPNK